MKKYLLILFIVLPIVFTACVSSRSHFNKGNYDLAIQKSAKKLMKNPNKEKQINILHKSFNIANQKDRDRISFLRSSRQAEIWEEIFELYSRLKKRQDLVRFLAPEILKRMNFNYFNYDNEIHAAKQNAAEFFYANAVRLLNEKNRMSARMAYYDLMKVKSYFHSFKDTDNLLKKAEVMGTVNILYQVKNATSLIMPEGFVNELTSLSMIDMNVLFRRFYNRFSSDIHFNYYVTLYINEIFTSPEHVREIHYTDKKEIQDGFQYVLDQNGNVMKDSLGNDIKVPRMITIRCNVIEFQQYKTVAVRSTISIFNEHNQPLINEPLTGEWVFDNRYILFKGDERALSEETRRKLLWKPLPFPSNEYMILQTTDMLKNMSKDFVYRNKNIFN